MRSAAERPTHELDVEIGAALFAGDARAAAAAAVALLVALERSDARMLGTLGPRLAPVWAGGARVGEALRRRTLVALFLLHCISCILH